MDERDLQAFARAWEQAPDGWSGRRYADALVAAERLDDAVAVCRAMWELGYPAGLTDLAWIEHDRGRVGAAVGLLREALPELDDEDRPAAEGRLGEWLWELDDPEAEPHLRAAVGVSGAARSDLADLLRVTGRADEGRRVLEAGVAADEVDSMLPLANILDEQGESDRAEALYRRAFDLGDAYSAWNLSILLVRAGRYEEADDWRWRAAQGGDETAIRSLARDDEEPPA